MPRCLNCGRSFDGDGLCPSCASSADSDKVLNRKKRETELFVDAYKAKSKKIDASHFTKKASIIFQIIVLVIAFFLFTKTHNYYLLLSGLTDAIGMKSVSENSMVEAIRKIRWTNFVSNEDSTRLIKSNTFRNTDLQVFAESDISYHMAATIKYGYQKTYFEEFKLEMDMSYNKELDIYKFVFSNIIISNDAKIQKYFNSFKEGTYYIVNESGKTYVLADNGGTKTVIDVSKNNDLYKRLMGLRAESVIGLDFTKDKETQVYGLYDGAMYKLNIKNEYSTNYKPIAIELKTYGYKPVYYYFCQQDHNLGLEQQFTYNFYYNKIPADKPSVADWK